MDISDIRRRLNEVDQNIGVEPINNTFNSIDIAGGEDTDDEGGSADITIKNVGRKFCPSPQQFAQTGKRLISMVDLQR